MNVLIGNTRVIEYKGIYIKYELDNLTGSIKDRAALSFMENFKDLNKTFVCATGGNFGISLSRLCKLNKQKLIVIMPKGNDEKRKLIEKDGTVVLETSKEEGMKGTLKILKTYRLNKEYVYINQFTSLYNPLGYISLCKEIVKSFKHLDYVVLGIGSGGTFYTINRVLKKCYPKIKVIGVLPDKEEYIEGIGANILNHSSKIKNDIIYIKRKEAIEKTKEINEDGIPVGISSGACLKVSLDLKKEHPNSVILMIAHDGIDRYRDIFE